MSNALAIGAVTAVIKNLLENGLVQQGISTSLGETPAITVVSPNPEGTNGAAQVKDRLNLFLYQTTLNPGWRNNSLPTRNSAGERVSNPPLALDLHYLLTAYSQEAFHAEIMLGYAMQLLYEMPVLTRDAIRAVLRTLTSSTQPALRALATADLADQVEQIKITPQPMNTEELSKLWSAIQTQYRPTAAYQVSVVLIDSQRSLKTTLPVRERRLFALPYSPIIIAELQPQIVTQGSVLTLRGQNLHADVVQLKFGTVTVPPLRSSDREIQVTVPAGLQAGISTVQVEHLLDFGPPSGLHRGFESNVMPFVLRPRILRVEAPNGVIDGKVTFNLTLEPVVGKTQRVTLFLNEQQSNASAAAYSATADKRDADTTPVTLPIPCVKAGRYLVRVQIDGAESLPEVDAENRYSGEPSVAIACTRNCLRVTQDDIDLTTTLEDTRLNVNGSITVQNETGVGVAGVTVAIAWALPDGSTRNDSGVTAANGRVTFQILGDRGTYRLTVTDLTKPGHCFDPPEDPAQTPTRRMLASKSVTG